MEKTSNVLSLTVDQLSKLVIPAFLEAGVDLYKDPTVYNKLLTEWNDRRVTFVALEPRHGFEIKVVAEVPDHEDPRDPSSTLFHVTCTLADVELPPSVVATGRCDRDGCRWSVQATGTMALPIGHPLAELAHGAEHLDLDRRTMMRPIDQRTTFAVVRKMARIWSAGQF